MALAIPLIAFGGLLIFRRKEISAERNFVRRPDCRLHAVSLLAAPWFLAVFQRVPQSAHYMILGQAAGHLLGTTIKNRPGGPFYFFGILAVGFLPWTCCWAGCGGGRTGARCPHRQKDGWLLLNVWAIFTFTLFSISQAKLPAYILPIFPALAVLLALRFFNEESATGFAPRWAWRICLASSLLLPATFPLLVKFDFHDELPEWLKWQTPGAVGIIILIFWLARKWKPSACAAGAVALTLMSSTITVAEFPLFETGMRDNQTLKPLGAVLREKYRPGDAVVCRGDHRIRIKRQPLEIRPSKPMRRRAGIFPATRRRAA